MRHRKAGRKLNRNASHRLALFRNLTRALFEHGRIVTTVAKAKELRPFVERLITLAKRGLASGDPIKLLHYRRICLSWYHNPEVIERLFNEVAPRYMDRPGGYTRVIKRHERRLGDGGETAFIELLKEGERKPERRRAAPQPAPVPIPPVVPQPAPQPKAEEATASPEAAASASETPANDTPPEKNESSPTS
jgi:large subunit ribosomal protein L17